MGISHVEMSPLQMVGLTYTDIHVRPFIHRDNDGEVLAPVIEFSDIDLACRVGCQRLSEQGDRDPEYIVEVLVNLSEEQVVEHQLPYVISVEASGQFRLVGDIDPARQDEVVEVNGASLVVGALRQLVADLTARSSHGAITLPTLRFVPERE